ncbi:Ff.00g118410.m01.CDS01 [Fusarium sp. VM40]|nr:Ff.00g118410.m01.CDS01 [Fusarium sp. VM40]
MAYYAEKLPWKDLASAFELKETNPCQREAPDLQIRVQPDTKERLAEFLNALMQNATADAITERQKYPEKYDVPNVNQVIITDDVAERIVPTVRRWHPEQNWLYASDIASTRIPGRGNLCPHENESEQCFCALAFKERKMAAFQRKWAYNDCYKFEEVNGEAFHNLEVVKSLLLHGGMEPILRSCSYEGCGLPEWWEQTGMFMILNLLYCFPETWDKEGVLIDDYRNIKSYQLAIRSSTKSGDLSDVATYPHRDFFGIEGGQFNFYPKPFDFARWKSLMKKDEYSVRLYKEMIASCDEPPRGSKCDSSDGDDHESIFNSEVYYNLEYYPYGLMSYEEFLNFENPVGYRPHSTDIPHVRHVLCEKGLPIELADQVMKAANYTPTRSLPIAGKPFHPGNRAEMDRYLEGCWQMIVRCVMVGNELGSRMPGENEFVRTFKECLRELFRCDCEGTYELFHYFDEAMIGVNW